MRTRKATPTIAPKAPVVGTGAQGSQGRQGSQGGPGATGAGDPGPPGQQGSQGESGLPGSVGAQGIPGQTGAQGAQGRPGNRGETGEHGVPGAQGSDGSRGEPGPIGQTGAQGDKGDTGTQGSMGPRGGFLKWQLWMWSCNGIDGTSGVKFIPSNGVGAASSNERVSFWGPAPAPGVVTDVAVFLSVAMTGDDLAVTLRRSGVDVATVSIPAGSQQAIITEDVGFDAGDVFSIKLTQTGEEVNIATGIRVVVYGHP